MSLNAEEKARLKAKYEDFAESVAIMYWALREQGFTDKNAMDIVVASIRSTGGH